MRVAVAALGFAVLFAARESGGYASAPRSQPAAAGGAPAVVRFKAPRSFWCLPGRPRQAQVTVGWSVPSATRVAVLLDGVRVHAGIRRALPFSVLAGDASGIGTTVVFRCRSGNRHRLTIRWRSSESAASVRRVTVRKARRR